MLLQVADAMWAQPRYADLPSGQRAQRVLARIRAADHADRGAADAVHRWARERGVPADGVVAIGEPLAFATEPVQGELFGETVITRPPATFGEAPFDVVIANVPRRELNKIQRERLRLRYDAITGQFTAEVPLVERLLDLVVPGGVIALRIRKAVLRREFGRALVEELGRRTQLLAVEEDGDCVVAAMRLSSSGGSTTLLRAFGDERAAYVLRAIESGARLRLGDLLDGAIGSTSAPGFDDVWAPPAWLASHASTVPCITGADVGRWRFDTTTILWPYDEHGRRRALPDETLVAWLSQFRALLESRELFGRSLEERDVRWYEYLEHQPERWGNVPAIVMAKSGSAPHVAVLRAPAVVAGSAFAMRPLPEADLHFVAGMLASSVASFWMKQTFHVYRTDDGSVFEATAAGLHDFPVPAHSDDVAQAARALERVARSIRPLRDAIAGEPERLANRLESAQQANARLRGEFIRHQTHLDAMTRAAYGLDEDERVAQMLQDPALHRLTDSGRAREQEVLLDWLVDRVGEAFATRHLPVDRPVVDVEVGDWLRSQPLARAVLARAGVSETDVLVRGAVPAEPLLTYSELGIDKLRRWADGAPLPFRAEDYAAVSISVPAISASVHRRNVWRWRGRFNVAREPFVLFVELSRERGRPHFAWGGTPRAAHQQWTQRLAEPQVQIDLERLIQMRAALTGRSATAAQLADEFYAAGWSGVDVDAALAALQRAGVVVMRGGNWRLG